MIKINTDRSRTEFRLRDLPTKCPHCHHSITPNPLFGHGNDQTEDMEVLMYCPNSECDASFIAHYYDMGDAGDFNGKTSIGNLLTEEFTDTVKEISPDFCKIYNEANFAEQHQLLEICGVGYRKALEFLIKDYAILNNSEKEDGIKKSTLASVIGTYVDDKRMKSVSKRAVWLGNDETHYVRKWEEKDLKDLKTLISLTLHWIEMEYLTSSFEVEMPEKPK